jgi:CRISPR-associated protein Csh2
MFKNRRQIVFVYSVKDANPNGDPLNDNHPRYDEETGQILSSDVRVKRTVRDEMMANGHDVFVDGQSLTMKKRFEALKKKFGTKSGEETLKNCIDTRLFGATFSLGKEAFSWTGPVQFKWARSLNIQKPVLVQGTAAFATNEGNSQRSFRTEYIVPYAVMASSAIANESASQTTDATDKDLDILRDSLWNGTKNLITRSKTEHHPLLLIEIKYAEDVRTHISSIEEYITLTDQNGNALNENDQFKLRNLRDYCVNISELTEKLERMGDIVKDVSIIADDRLTIRNETGKFTVERR